ncbi:hypothetical protein FF1_011157 [Malus domestica]
MSTAAESLNYIPSCVKYCPALPVNLVQLAAKTLSLSLMNPRSQHPGGRLHILAPGSPFQGPDRNLQTVTMGVVGSGSNTSSLPSEISRFAVHQLVMAFQAVDFVTLTHSEARNLISDLKVAPPLDDSLAWYLDHSVKLFDLCNSISAEIKRLRQRRLHFTFVLHLLGDRKGEEVKELDVVLLLALESDRTPSLSDFNRGASFGFGKRSNAEVLVRDLNLGPTRLSNAPCGKISSVAKLVRRRVHSVGLVTVSFSSRVSYRCLCGICHHHDMVCNYHEMGEIEEVVLAMQARINLGVGGGSRDQLAELYTSCDDQTVKLQGMGEWTNCSKTLIAFPPPLFSPPRTSN